MSKTYCINVQCPFRNCDKHPAVLKGKQGTAVFAAYDSICRKYLSWVLERISNNEIQTHDVD